MLEIGDRMALGATPGAVLRMVVGQGLRPVRAGTVIGGLASLVPARRATKVQALDAIRSE